MTLLTLLLLVNAVLHGIIVGRFGFKGNEPPAVFGLLYAVLAIAAFLGWPYVPLITLVVTTVGLLGLALGFRKLQHDTTVEKIIFVVGAVIIAFVATTYLLLVR